jgi:PPOX class probable F420-dependent enzyme
MSDEDAYSFLMSQRVGVLGTVGPDGMPHLVNVNYIIDGRQIILTSFAAAQKVRNIERTGSATFLVEVTGPYNEIRGVMASGRARVVADTRTVVDMTTRLAGADAARADDGHDLEVERHAAKRVSIFIEPTRLRSWDHRQLGGTY